MSRYFSARYDGLQAYTPGEQPRDAVYVKLNTNESPFPPSPGVLTAVSAESIRLQLYSDPDCTALVNKLADYYEVEPDQVIVSNGSDEVLNFAFMAFADEEKPLAFPDITYGFYPVFAQLNRIPYTEIPLTDDYRIDPADYCGIEKTIVIANPNAPTGIALTSAEIEQIVATNPDNVIIVDEAYVDFGAESVIPLTKRYDNLLVTQTFSKSRSLAGARLGFGIGSAELIRDLNTIRFSTNPYNVNRMTLAAGVAALEEDEYYQNNCGRIRKNRSCTVEALEKLGFTILPSEANFLFAEHPAIDGETLYRRLKERGVLVRYFSKPRIANAIRISIGTCEQMEFFVKKTEEILREAI